MVMIGSQFRPSRPPQKLLPSEQVKMTFWIEFAAYRGYFWLFVLGVVREYILRVMAFVWKDPMALSYVGKERWSTGWVEFYLQHMYKFYTDNFNRPIASAPKDCVDVILRERPGGILFGPLHDFSFTD